MPSLQQYLEGKIVRSTHTEAEHLDLLLILPPKIQDFEGQKLVERISYYAVIELAVRLLACVSKPCSTLNYFCFHTLGILVLFGILVSVYTSDLWGIRFGDYCHTRGT